MVNNLTILEDLQKRNLIHTTTTQDIPEKSVVYCGFDPTAKSLQVGNLIMLLTLRQFQRFGHTPIILLGGATGSIGDPSGKSQERNLLTQDIIQENIKLQTKQLERFIDLDNAIVVNNYDWTSQINVIDFLRDIGKHFTIANMLTKESVKSRLESGISFTEFSYMLLQAYDFLHLNEKYGCTIQIGGSDQWGNMCAGIELIRRKCGKEVHAITVPLLTDSNGKKFGKTEQGTIWLDLELTSSYEFYQFWLNQSDDSILEFLLKFFICDKIECEKVSLKLMRYVLAEAMTSLVHGTDVMRKAKRCSDILFSGNIDGLTGQELQEIFSHVPSVEVKKKEKYSIFELLYDTKLITTKGEVRRLVKQKGLKINNIVIDDVNNTIKDGDMIDEMYCLVKKGKKTYFLIHVIN